MSDIIDHERPPFDMVAAMNTKPPVPVKTGNSRPARLAKRDREDDLRARIQNSKQLDQAFKTIENIEKVYAAITKIQATKFTRGHQAKFSTQLAALKMKLDAHFRFLNKVVPDLKSVELTDPDGNGPRLTLTVTPPAPPTPTSTENTADGES